MSPFHLKLYYAMADKNTNAGQSTSGSGQGGPGARGADSQVTGNVSN